MRLIQTSSQPLNASPVPDATFENQLINARPQGTADTEICMREIIQIASVELDESPLYKDLPLV